MLSLFCLFAVIGGKNIYLRLRVSGKCDNKDSVWEMLQKEVLYSVALTVFNLGKNCGRKKYCCWSAKAGRQHIGRVRKGVSSSCRGGPGGLPPGKF